MSNETIDPMKPISPTRALGAFGFARMIRSGGYVEGDAEMVAAKFEQLGNEIERLRAALVAAGALTQARATVIMTP